MWSVYLHCLQSFAFWALDRHWKLEEDFLYWFLYLSLLPTLFTFEPTEMLFLLLGDSFVCLIF